MSNRSYCRFGNTLEDLEDCRDAMLGMDQYYQSRDDISDDEFNAMTHLIEVCREIVSNVDDDCNVLSSKEGEHEDS